MKYYIFLYFICFCFVSFSQINRNTPKQRVLQDDIGDVSIVKFNKSGNKLVVGYDYGKIELWQLGEDTNKILWSNHKWYIPISSLNFVDEINQIVLVNKGGGIAFFDAENGNLSKTFVVDFKIILADAPERISESDYNVEQNILAVSGSVADRVLLIDVLKLYRSKKNSSDSIYIINSNEWKRIYPYPKESSLVYTIKTPKPRDGSIVKDLVSDIESFANDDEIITCIKIDPTFKFVLAGTKAGKIIRWTIEDSTIEIFADKILQVVPSRDQSEFKDILGIDCRDSLAISVSFYSSTAGQMQFWETSDLSLVTYRREADPSTCRRIRLSLDNKYAVTTGDFSYRIWKFDGNDYNLVSDLMYNESVGYSKKFSSVDFWTNKLLAVGEMNNVYIYRLDEFKYLKNLRMTSDSLKIWSR